MLPFGDFDATLSGGLPSIELIGLDSLRVAFDRICHGRRSL